MAKNNGKRAGGNINSDDKDQSFNLNGGSLRVDHELFHDEEHIKFPIVRIKYMSMPNDGCKWKIMSDDNVMCVIEGSKINKADRKFLQTVEGVNWLLGKAKAGISSWQWLKKELKKVVATHKPTKPVKRAQSKTKVEPAKKRATKKKH